MFDFKTKEVTTKEKKSSRIQKLRKHLSCGFGRLSISKEEIIPEFGQDNENLEAIIGNGVTSSHSEMLSTCAEPVDNIRSLLEPNGNVLPPSASFIRPLPRTSSSHSHLDKYLKKFGKSVGGLRSPVKRQWSAGESNLSREFSKTSDLDVRPQLPPRPKSEFFNVGDKNKYFKSNTYEANLGFGRSESYIKLEQLGEGSYATVFKGFSELNNRVVALKEIRLQPEEGAPFTAIREASLLRGLKHANIVTLHDIIHTRETLTFVFEYVHTDLSQYLERHPGGLHPKNIKLFMFQLLRGLAFCHQRRVLHRDLKPQNLLISEIGELKLADFGLARAKSVPSRTFSHEVVTLWYRPPDVLLGSTNYSTSLDMWGVGCIFVEMIIGKAAFQGMKDTMDQLDKIWRVLGTPTEDTWDGVSSLPNYKPHKFGRYQSQPLSGAFPRITEILHGEKLAYSFLQLQPRMRISASEALRHIYFKELPPKLFDLPEQISIYTVSGCKLCPEPNNIQTVIKIKQ
ncbi:cyclin-dependent kinase 14 isoform X3 [Parasteatoda tepidariorum]|uniref:cyclin-dependent kinase 14 isoform X3 n=1 Tax=Parasteatoda tepidariorum TaxID=114398 RepID=UPI001C720DBA|nr:cyclin-dependent kinase 14 isoform X3 [Parasteatoda tepidariorum]